MPPLIEVADMIGIEPVRERRTRSGAHRLVITVSLFMCLFGFQSAEGNEQLGEGARAYAHKDYARAARLLRPEAQSGQPIAQTYLGHLYENGWGVPQDYNEAAKWLTLAAEQGEPTAQFLLGRLYDNGSGVKQDFIEAEFWFDLAAANAAPEHRDYWINMRDAVAGKLTRDELTQARARARAWTGARAQ
jgi:hypothetical protein